MLKLLTAFGVLIALLPAAERKRLSASDLDQIAELLMLEDARRFDEGVLGTALRSGHPELRRRAAISIGRIADLRGKAMLAAARKDPEAEVVAAVAFATGQLKDAEAIEWLTQTLGSPEALNIVAQEAARSLGKIQTPESAAALARYLLTASTNPARIDLVGEALLSY